MTYIERQRLLDKARAEKIVNDWQIYHAWLREQSERNPFNYWVQWALDILSPTPIGDLEGK